jgi:serine phosphatase RsbU (regulator of sigma subunit)/CHASE3 domain sensor protein
VAALAGVFVVVGVLLGVAVANAVHRSSDAVTTLSMRWSPATSSAQGLLADVVDQETGERGYLFQGDAQFLQPFEDGTTNAAREVTRLRRFAAGDAVVLAAVRSVDTAISTWRQRSALPEIAVRRADHSAVPPKVDLRPGKVLFDDVRTRVLSLQRLIEARRDAAQANVRSANRTLTEWLWVTAGIAVVIAVGIVLALRGWVLRPLRRLSRALRRVAEGDLAAPVDVVGPPEFEAVGADAEGMRRRILDELERSESTRQALEQRGPLVVALSEHLTPASTDPIPGLRYAAVLRPAEGLLAGDWVDALPLGRERVALMLLDVSGHGAAAGLEAMRLKHVLTTALRFGRAPHEAMAQAAAGFAEDERFATAVIVVLDVVTGELRWSNAGHLPPRIVPTRGDRLDPEQLVALQPTGPMLSGLTSGWTTATGRLEIGQLLLAFSDGLTEARDGNGREFGVDGICAALGQTNVRDVDTAVSACLAAVRAHGVNPHRDDVTIVAASRDPSTVFVEESEHFPQNMPRQQRL